MAHSPGSSRIKVPAGRYVYILICLVLASFVHNSQAHNYEKFDNEAISVCLDTSTQSHQEITTLQFGQVVQSDLASDQKHTYQIALTSGQYANLVIEQRGIDVVVRVLRPDDQQVAEFDDEIRPRGDETPEVVAEMDGRYKIQVASKRQDVSDGSYSIRFAELRDATDQDRRVEEARVVLAECVRHWRGGKYDSALSHCRVALATREELLGPNHPQVAAALNMLGIVHMLKGDLDQAHLRLQRALTIRQNTFGNEHPSVASTLNNIAEVNRLKGDYSAADRQFRLSIDSWERSLGRDHSFLALPLSNLAIVRRVLGDYVEAESLYQRALAIREKTLGAEHAEVAASMNNLGSLYMVKGDLSKAEMMLLRAVRIWEQSLGPEHPNVAAAFNNLGAIHQDRGDLNKAEELHRHALKLWEKALGPDHPSVASGLDHLAIVLSDRGAFEEAEKLLQRALKIREKALGQEHPDVALSLRYLARLYSQKGKFEAADPLFQSSLNILENAFGAEHPQVSVVLSHMAASYAARGKAELATGTQARANAIIESNLVLNLSVGSERQKLAYLSTLAESTEQTISLHVDLAPESETASSLAVTTILQRKGRVQDAMSNDLLGLRRRSNPQDQQLLDQLNEIIGRLARLVLSGPQKVSLAEHQKRIAVLEELREQIEHEISIRSAGFFKRAEPVTLMAVQALIPANAALIEIASYRPLFGNHQSQNDDLHSVAYVLRRDGAVQWLKLGEAKQLDALIHEMRQGLGNPGRTNVKEVARALDEKLMRPLRSLIGDATQLLISPDGGLNLIPFEALVDESGHYLLERYAISYLTSGRDLLRLQTRRESQNKPIVVANPTFGEPAMIVTDASDNSNATASDRAQFDSSRLFFGPLPGVAAEVSSLKQLLPEATFFTREQATEAILKRIRGPTILHVATHGFFFQSEDLTSSADEVAKMDGTRLGKWVARVENPLLRSGLALAGANQGRSGDDDGVLTALEATTLDLWGTKLVVLSACDTGLGDVKNGDGVYGLRRALFLAGTESQLMSLWPVSDRSTRDLMASYYKQLMRGAGRGEALRKAQLEMLRSDTRRHPYYWASFILAGEWANLKGQR